VAQACCGIFRLVIRQRYPSNMRRLHFGIQLGGVKMPVVISSNFCRVNPATTFLEYRENSGLAPMTLTITAPHCSSLGRPVHVAPIPLLCVLKTQQSATCTQLAHRNFWLLFAQPAPTARHALRWSLPDGTQRSAIRPIFVSVLTPRRRSNSWTRKSRRRLGSKHKKSPYVDIGLLLFLALFRRG
jgi:hypothetical protein